MKVLTSEDYLPNKILILDDSAFDRARLRRVINIARIQCQILEIGSLAELNELLCLETIDIVILDYDLPDGTGHDALKRIKACEHNSQLVSIMVTGNDAAHIARGALKRGCSSCLLKSELRPEILKQAITEGLRNDWNGHERTILGEKLTPTLTVVRDG